MNIKTLEHTNPDFPNFLPLLKPPVLKIYYRGLPLDNLPSVSIVGSRKPTKYGQETTYEIASKLARLGITIVSGLAYGVDAIAHRAALEADGKTVAVLPGSLDKIYPAAHANLAEQITKQGSLVSEHSKGAPVYKHSFLERNRIVAALGDVLVITEAAERSGTMSTARFALELGKTVMVVPGSIYSPLSRGTNNLLKAGATVITDVSDVLLELGLKETEIAELNPANETEAKILELIKSGVHKGEELQLRTKLDPSLYMSAMTDMEINGVIRCIGDDEWILS